MIIRFFPHSQHLIGFVTLYSTSSARINYNKDVGAGQFLQRNR